MRNFVINAGKKGIRVSPWVNAKMKEFIEEERAVEAEKEANKKKTRRKQEEKVRAPYGVSLLLA